jgi:Protein of unknown function (DUF2442)
MTALPSVVRAEYQGEYWIHLVFSDSSEATVNFLQWLDGPVFEPLKDPSYFRRFFIDGGTVVWPNGADIAPETLYDAVQATRPNPALQPTAPARAKRRG